MTTIPKYVYIKTIKFNVVVWPSTELWRRSGSDLLGRSEYMDARLSVREHMQEDVQAQVLLHEIFHAIETSCGFNFSEKIIFGMANGFFEVLRNNPDLVAYLMSAGREEPS